MTLRSTPKSPVFADVIPSQIDVAAILFFYAYPTTHALVYGFKERFLKDQIHAIVKKYLVKRQWRREARIASKLYHVSGVWHISAARHS